MGKWINDHLGWLVWGTIGIIVGWGAIAPSVFSEPDPTPIPPTLDYRDYSPSDQEIEDARQEMQQIEEATYQSVRSDLFFEELAETCFCDANEYNCDEFKKEYIAQICYDRCMDQVGYDVHWLDEDKDGNACEALP